VVALHEGLAAPRAQDPALAAHRLADQERLGLGEQAGRVELEDPQGNDRRARTYWTEVRILPREALPDAPRAGPRDPT
jgi:hypothetical protein